ncbi:MAG: ABC transporter permease [Clostridia bacterium]|nr:ABC transporter permease [Clostridia bacterium]
MDIRENLRIAIFSIKTNLMRSLLTMLGIIIGVASVIAIITLGSGGRDYIVGMIEDMGSNNIQISVNASNAHDNDYITAADIEAIRSLDGVQYCSPYEIGYGFADFGKESGLVMTVSGNEDLTAAYQMPTKYGRFWTKEECDQSKNVCVVSTITAQNIYGTENCVGETMSYTVNNQSVTLKIIGVVDITQDMVSDDQLSMLDDMGLTEQMPMIGMIGIPSTLNGYLNNKVDSYMMLSIIATDGADLDNVGETVLNMIKTRHSSFDDSVYSMSIMATYIDLLDSVISIFTTFIAAVSAISLIVGGIGVMNIMLVSVTERTREIGIRKALGAKTSTIMIQFLTESIILCLIGGIIGLILGAGGAMAVAAYLGIPIRLKVSTILIAVGFSSAIGIFFGIYPAKRAAQLTPIEALRRD